MLRNLLHRIAAPTWAPEPEPTPPTLADVAREIARTASERIAKEKEQALLREASVIVETAIDRIDAQVMEAASQGHTSFIFYTDDKRALVDKVGEVLASRIESLGLKVTVHQPNFKVLSETNKPAVSVVW